jgi:hypothetical protein
VLLRGGFCAELRPAPCCATCVLVFVMPAAEGGIRGILYWYGGMPRMRMRLGWLGVHNGADTDRRIE